jgi:hypothetical protein
MPLTRAQRRRQVVEGFDKVQKRFLIPAEIGKLEDDGTYTVYETQAQNIIYARLIHDDNKLVIAYNLTVKPKARGAIWLQRTIDGYEVAGLRAKRSVALYGEAAPGMNVPDVPGELANTIIAPRNYLPGLVRIAIEDTLSVQVEPFWYRYHDTWRRWTGDVIDLTDYLPVAAAQWHWAMICIQPSTDRIVVVTGDSYGSVGALTDSILSDIGAQIDGLVPCDAVRLQEGLTSLRTEYFQHGRLNAAEIGPPSFPETITSLYYHIPAQRKVVWPAPLTISGTLTIEGTLRIQ